MIRARCCLPARVTRRRLQCQPCRPRCGFSASVLFVDVILNSLVAAARMLQTCDGSVGAAVGVDLRCPTGGCERLEMHQGKALVRIFTDDEMRAAAAWEKQERTQIVGVHGFS